MYIRDIEGRVRPEIGGGYPEPLFNLFGSLGAKVLNVAILSVHIVGVEVGDGWDVGMGDPAVVTLIVVIGKNLPVEIALHVPGMIKDIVFKVVVIKARLFVNPVKVILPGHLGHVSSIQIDPNEAVSVDMEMDWDIVVSVESAEATLIVSVNHELIASHLVRHPVPTFGDTMLMSSEKPFPREDRSSFKLVKCRGGVPRSR